MFVTVADYVFNVKIKKGHQTGVLIGISELFPGVIVCGKTEKQVVKRIKKAIEGYLFAFPEEQEKIN